MNQHIRLAAASDSETILKIYAPYIENTAISFETQVPTAIEFSTRIQNICKQYPYLVYEVDDEIIGYTYAAKHRERAAYLYNVEVSIYVLPEYHGLEVAYKLYDCLFALLKRLGYYNAYAGYTVPNMKSKKFHEKFGFTLVGSYHKTGYKFGRWHDVIWLEKTINDHKENLPTRVMAIGELTSEDLDNILSAYVTGEYNAGILKDD